MVACGIQLVIGSATNERLAFQPDGDQSPENLEGDHLNFSERPAKPFMLDQIKNCKTALSSHTGARQTIYHERSSYIIGTLEVRWETIVAIEPTRCELDAIRSRKLTKIA